MGTPLPRRRVLLAVATAAGALGLASACTGSSTPIIPTSAAPTAPDPLLAVLEERAGLVEAYAAAGRQHPQLLPRLQPLRTQTEEQVMALRLALALPERTPASTALGTTGTTGASGTSGTSGATTSPTATAVPVEPAVTLSGLRAAVRASGSAAAAVCATTTAERAPLVGSLAAAAACHELLLS
ncbi:MAG: hypothetical protein H0U09_14500 [Geodermatophilaceae bacterium]|nr:hypothetical protein [Geodermatophilaceae bacterium]